MESSRILIGYVALAMVSGCGPTAQGDSRVVHLSHTDDWKGLVTLEGGTLEADLVSSETGELVASATWDIDTNLRQITVLERDEVYEESIEPPEAIDVERFLAHDLAVVVSMSDTDPSNDFFASDVRSNSASTLPRGSFDRIGGSATNNLSRRRIEGWACDPDRWATSLRIHAYGSASLRKTTVGGFMGEVLANLKRSDVAPSCKGTTNHGYNANVNSYCDNIRINGETATSESVEVFALNVRSDGSIDWNNNPKIGENSAECTSPL